MRTMSFFAAALALCVLSSATFMPGVATACTKPATAADLRTAGQQGLTAFADLEIKTLLKLATAARQDILPCIREELTPADAAIFHRLMALEAYIGRNDSRVLSELHAARKLESGYVFPTTVVEEGHPLLDFYNRAANIKDGGPEPIYAPERGYVLVDGLRNAQRFTEVPAIIQVYGESGLWIETHYILPGAKLPIWGKNVFGITAKDLGIDDTPIWKKPLPWYVSAGVSLVVAGTFFGLAAHERTVFNDPSTPDADLSGHRDRITGYGITAITTSGLAALFTGLGIGMQVGFGDEDALPGGPRE